jgi:hypothetical protein
MLTEPEIFRGLVLHLDPDALEREGGTYSCLPDRRVHGGHFFLCLEVDAGQGEWLPLYTKDGVGRRVLEKDGRRGHSKWTSADCFYHVAQVWRAPHRAVILAAQRGKDMSSPGGRNSVSEEYVPTIDRRSETDRIH